MKLTQKLQVFCRHHFTDNPYGGPEQEQTMKIARLGFDPQSYYNNLKHLGPGFTVTTLAIIPYLGKDYPICCIDFNTSVTPVRRIFVLAGSHGNEEAGLYAIEKFLKYLQDNAEHYQDVSVRIVAPHNPVGVAYFSRYNGDGVDINRDFKAQKSLEAQAVASAFEVFKPTIAISLHEGPQSSGMFLYTNKYMPKSDVSNILNALQVGDIRLATKSYFGNTLKQPGNFPHAGLFLILLTVWGKLFKFQGFGPYCASQSIPAVVTETSWQKADKTQRVEAQYIALKALLDLHSSD